MNTVLVVLACVFVGFFVWQLILARPGLPLHEAKAALHAGTAVLIDVREPSEWATTGVAKDAARLPLSDLRGARREWRRVLEQNKDKRLLLYCASGTRSGMAARQLVSEGWDAVNAGSLRDWDKAGWPICRLPRD
jgi:rhodanese-related sulfurtransferase